MSIYDDDELQSMNVVRFETTIGTTKIRFTTPKTKGCKAIIDLGEGRPRNWDERKGPGTTGATLVPTGPGLASGTITIEYIGGTPAERAEMRLEREQFALMVGSPGAGNPDKSFTINHPMTAAMQPPMVACVFLNDAPIVLEEASGKTTEVWKIKEFRKQLPTLSSVTAPGQESREGKALDQYEAQQKERLAEYDQLAAEAGLASAGGP